LLVGSAAKNARIRETGRAAPGRCASTPKTLSYVDKDS
jgi:hypothetical protein